MVNGTGFNGLGQTIAIVDRSGKVVSTSRHLLNVFSEAKNAYRERKAEIVAEREGQRLGSALRPGLPHRSYTVDDSVVVSKHSSRRPEPPRRSSHHRRHSTSPVSPTQRHSRHSGLEAPRDRGHHSTSGQPSSPAHSNPHSPAPNARSSYPPSPGYAQGHQAPYPPSPSYVPGRYPPYPQSPGYASAQQSPYPLSPGHPPPPGQYPPPSPGYGAGPLALVPASPGSHPPSPGMYSPSPGYFQNPNSPVPPSPGAVGQPPTFAGHALGTSMVRRASLPLIPRRPRSTADVNMDLAYGEPPPNLFEDDREDDAELKGLVGRVRGILDEAHCVHYSVTETVKRLQQNPDAMAAVALSLAEISTLVEKMAPGALFQVRRMAPAVFGLLTSPQFLIAAGVGVGVTIVALGGYKIVRRIQEKRKENAAEEAMLIRSDLSQIDTWRRGVAESDVRSVGTSVEGELITPTAARMSRMSLDEMRVAPPPMSDPRQYRARASTVRSKTVRSSRAGSTKSGGSSRSGESSRSKHSHHHHRRSSREEGSRKEGSKKHHRRHHSDTEAPHSSPLRLMFRS